MRLFRSILPSLLGSTALTLSALLLAPVAAMAQDGPGDEEPQIDEPIVLEPLVVTPTRTQRVQFEAPASTHVLDAEELARKGYRTIPQALRQVPGVMVQETAAGHGSPYIRGFTSFRNLFLIDGIRLNNSVFRPGPNQYWNTVDAGSVERIEIVKGPSSVLYGSDAIGGTVHAITKGPNSWDASKPWSARLEYRASDAANYNKLRAEYSLTDGETWGALLGASWKDFGDMQGGAEVGLQRNTGYDEWDGDLKIEGFVSDYARLVIAHYAVDQRNVPRTHKTDSAISWEGTTIGSDRQRDLDQRRSLSYVQLHTEGMGGFFQSSTTSLSYQRLEEERDRIKSSGAREQQGFDVGTLGLLQHFTSDSSLGRLTYGFDFYHDEVSTFLDKGAGQSAADDIQGPVANDATYDLLGIFVQDEVELNERLDLIAGARFSYAAADAGSVRDPVTDERMSIDEDWSALVASVRLVYEVQPDELNLFGGISQGFRAPNLSDLSRFDSARTDEFEVPAPDLEPEYTTSFELGVRAQKGAVAAESALFYTAIEDQIQRVPTGLLNADGESQITKDNVGDGYVWGIEAGLEYALTREWSLFGNGTFLEGKVDTFPTSDPVVQREYLSRLMPLSLYAGARWEEEGGRFWGEAAGMWAQTADRLSTRDESDTSRIPPGGTPGYAVFDLRGGWQAREGIALFLAVENIFDEDYRVHGSGSNRPGRNLLIGVSFSF